MIDVKALRGSTVRDAAGTTGEIMNTSTAWLKVGWWDEGAIRPREESFLRSDPRVKSIHILTLTDGWIPVVDLIGVSVKEGEKGPHGPVLVEDLQGLLLEKPRSPFKTAASIGPGPAHGWRHGGPSKMKHKKRDYWDCSGSNYVYKCKGKEGENKTVRVNKANKADYNALYKQWRKARLDVAAPITRIKKRLARKKKAAAAAKKKKK